MYCIHIFRFTSKDESKLTLNRFQSVWTTSGHGHNGRRLLTMSPTISFSHLRLGLPLYFPTKILCAFFTSQKNAYIPLCVILHDIITLKYSEMNNILFPLLCKFLHPLFTSLGPSALIIRFFNTHFVSNLG